VGMGSNSSETFARDVNTFSTKSGRHGPFFFSTSARECSFVRLIDHPRVLANRRSRRSPAELAEALAVERRRGLAAIGGRPHAEQNRAADITKLEHHRKDENRNNGVSRIISPPGRARTEDGPTENDGGRQEEDSESASQQRSDQQTENGNGTHDTTP